MVSRIWFCGSASSTRWMNARCSSTPNANMAGMTITIETNGIDVEQLEDEEGDVHPEHQQIAVREVDDAHDAEHERQPDADEGVDPADQDATQQRLQEQHHPQLRPRRPSVGLL